MDAGAVKALISSKIDTEFVEVQGEGAKYHVTVVSNEFSGLMPVKKQQLIYSCLNDEISSGVIHAVTMALHTPAEWAKK